MTSDPALSDPEVRADLRRRDESERDPARARVAMQFGDLFGELVLPSKTDDEWAAHDARVREALARSSGAAGGPPRDRMGELEGRGFPRRALLAVAKGVRPAPAITRLVGEARGLGILVISGPRGVGKTCAATWLAAERRDPWRFVRASSYLASSRYDRAAREELWSGALVLDDLGAEYADAKGSALADLDELVDVYYASMRPLVITTNMLATDFAERHGERIADRLRECGRWISIAGESHRRAARDGAR